AAAVRRDQLRAQALGVETLLPRRRGQRGGGARRGRGVARRAGLTRWMPSARSPLRRAGQGAAHRGHDFRAEEAYGIEDGLAGQTAEIEIADEAIEPAHFTIAAENPFGHFRRAAAQGGK